MDLHGGHHWIMGEHFRLFTKFQPLNTDKANCKSVLVNKTQQYRKI